MVSSVHLGGFVRRVVVWIKKPLHMVLFVAFIVIVTGTTYLVWYHFAHKNSTPPVSSSLKGAARDEAVNSQIMKDNLGSKDYEAYQSIQQMIAIGYLNASDTSNGLRIINDIIKKIPADKINSETYAVMVRAQRAIHNTAELKKYLGLYIARLKIEGGNNASIIASAEEELASL